MGTANTIVARWWRELDRPGWRSFFLAIAALSVALALALYSSAAAEAGRVWQAGATALGALALAGWVAVTIVPALARRTPLRWFAYHVHYKLTREGMVYVAGVFVVALAALNTGNNLLFLILASLLAGIIVSGVVSRMVISGVELELELPEHIFAQQPVTATVVLRNEKQTLPSFSLRVVGEAGESRRAILTRPVFFPHLPRRQTVRQKVELEFPRRGVYRQDAFGIQTRFPFGFLQKTRRVESKLEVYVYPRVEPTEEFYEILPLLTGELESYQRGRGHDLYSIRDYQTTDSARFVDWKASAKTGALKVREFAREDERRVVLALDSFVPAGGATRERVEKFERAVALAACLAWHFHEIDSVMQFCCAAHRTAMLPAGELIYDVLRHLATVQAQTAQDGGNFLSQIAEECDVFKIVLTSRPRGTIPTSLWASSYMIFLDAL